MLTKLVLIPRQDARIQQVFDIHDDHALMNRGMKIFITENINNKILQYFHNLDMFRPTASSTSCHMPRRKDTS